MEEKSLKYKNYVFDLYGTLIDMWTDEEDPAAWEKMVLLYGYYGARYEAEELRETYRELVKNALSERWRELSDGTESPSRTALSCGAGASRRSGEDFEKEIPEKVPFECPADDRGENQEGGTKYIGMDLPENDDPNHIAEIRIEDIFRSLFARKGVEATAAMVLQACQMFRIVTTRRIRLFPRVKEELLRLRRQGARLYLLTNAQRVFTEYELRYLEIEDCFDGIVMSSDRKVKKPDPGFFGYLLETYGLDPSESVMIGDDGICDITGGKRAGMHVFHVCRETEKRIPDGSDDSGKINCFESQEERPL